MFDTLFDTVAVLFVIAAFFGFLNYKLFRLPFAIGVLVSSLVASLIILGVESIYPMGIGPRIRETLLTDIHFADALMHGMLSFLLFAGALHTDWTRLKRWAAPILTLASVGVLISTGLIGVASWGVFGALGVEVPLSFCLVFGALITPTDPVAVLGIMKAAGAPKDVEIKVVGESLFNDGVGVVLFTVLVAIALATSGVHPVGGHAEEVSTATVLSLIGVEVLGGVGLGLVGGYIAYLAMRTMEEPNLEALITVALVMGISFVAFQIHSSAPLACVVAGLFIGNRGREEAMGDATREAVDTVWSFIDEALNAILFLLIGFEVVAFTFTGQYLLAALVMIAIALLARGASVLLPMVVLERRLDFVTGTKRILWWGGIKGGISIALALSLPPFPGRELVLTVTYATVIVSVLLQGLTIGPVIQRITGRELDPQKAGFLSEPPPE